MAKPQQPELRRSGQVPALDPDAVDSRVEAHSYPGDTPSTGPIPEDQRPGHTPESDSDKPMDKMAAALGIVDDDHEPDSAPDVTGRAHDHMARDTARDTARGGTAARSRPIGVTIALAVAGGSVAIVMTRMIVRRLRS